MSAPMDAEVAPYIYNLGTAFLKIASAYPDRAALRRAGSEDVTYSELAQAMQRTAQGLTSLGVVPGSLVALQNSKSLSGYAAMLACLLLGAAYTHLDPANPSERTARILQSCRPIFVLCDDSPSANIAEAALELGIRVLTIDALKYDSEVIQALDLELVTGDHTAYVMFTSGSTGTPKGVAISHSNVLNFIAWARTTFSIRPSDVLAGVNPVYFDNSVFDVYAALFNGACLAPLKKEDVADARRVLGLLDDAGCTIWFSVPSLLIYLRSVKALQASSLSSIRVIAFGGEGYPLGELRHLYQLFGDRSELFNVYGPTECTCICSAYKISANDLNTDLGLAPLGKLAQNFDYAILDSDVPVAAGEAGELCLIGPQVGQGYYNDPERSAAVFVSSPVHGSVPRPMYRTGDIVREIDGLLHFVGRKDNQIKHMGYRIELEEIEAAISRLDYVSQTAVIYSRTHERFGHLIAHVAVLQGSIDAARLRADLVAKLPTYMIPDRFNIVESLPKNANGKVDRKALLAQ